MGGHPPPEKTTAQRLAVLERWHRIYDKAIEDGLDEAAACRLAESPAWLKPGEFATGRPFWPSRDKLIEDWPSRASIFGATD